jgi:hypothetical protein
MYGPVCDGRGGLAERAERVWLLTGTPMPNHAGELCMHLHALLPETATPCGQRLSCPEFLDRYCVVSGTGTGRGWSATEVPQSCATRSNPMCSGAASRTCCPSVPRAVGWGVVGARRQPAGRQARPPIVQTRPALVRFVSLAGSLDEAITEVLRRKSRLIAQIID